jgi:hypothetical protein
MDKIWEKAVLILAENLNSGLSYLITTVPVINKIDDWAFALKPMICDKLSLTIICQLSFS